MIHILGICGTFMAGVATLAKQAGHEVTGSDQTVYPPMSTLLDSLGIEVQSGYHENSVGSSVQSVVIGNALSRGNAAVEAVLNRRQAYTSGPQWIQQHILKNRPVYAVAGTHGKTTTSSLLAWLLADAQLNPGYLIGGKPLNFEASADIGNTDAPFVIEADEYDTAFFDKRSKFVHYRPQVAILNNLEFDHADIFDDLQAIETQFHHLVRSVPNNGMLIVNADSPALQAVLDIGCWTPVETFSLKDDSADWYATPIKADASSFAVYRQQQKLGEFSWAGFGAHNLANALAAIAAAMQAGVSTEQLQTSISRFKFPAKRLQQHANAHSVILYEDFAHHPSAIALTIESLKAKHPGKTITAVLEPRSNTMKMGIHNAQLSAALEAANEVFIWLPEGIKWSLNAHSSSPNLHEFTTYDALRSTLELSFKPNQVVVVMSNGPFNGLIESLTLS